MELTVTRPFGDYQPGDRITDPKEVEAVLAGDNSGNVVQTAPPAKGPKAEDRG